MTHTLTINDCELLVHLGWTEEERKNKQRVLFSLQLQFDTPLLAASTDQLENTVCYRTLIQFLREQTASKPFALLEYLGQSLLNLIESHLVSLTLPHPYSMTLTVTKWPCISGLPNGVSFTCKKTSS